MREKNKANEKFRHELKYLCTEAELSQIRNRINHLMQYDKHVGENHEYQIRSVYFDYLDNRCYYENENGTDPREKYRIRMYNANKENLHLELKRKENGKTLKQSCSLTYEQCYKILHNQPVAITKENPALLNKFLLQRQIGGLCAKTIVEYDREPFVYKSGNVRVTFDRAIRSSNVVTDFFEEKLCTRLILPSGQHVLEVKYDELLPDFIYNNVQISNLRQTAFSKYYLCRKYTIGGSKHDIF